MIKRVLGELGLAGWTLACCGAAAVLIAVLDFMKIVPLTVETSIQIILVAIGAMMGAIVAQGARRAVELQELRDSLNATSVELIDSTRFNLHVQQSCARAKRFVSDTTLHQSYANLTHPADNPNHYAYTIYERLKKKEITTWAVEIIPSRERLESVIARLIIFDGLGYFIRYVDAPKPIPILNIISIDNEWFYLGSFYGSGAPAEMATDVFIRSQQIAHILTNYWNYLWSRAIPLNEANRINWDELKRIAQRLGMTDAEFDSIVTKWRDEVQRRSRRRR